MTDDVGLTNALDAYTREACRSLHSVKVSDFSGREILFGQAVADLVAKLVQAKKDRNRFFFIGNGGSAAIASEVANRFWKYCGIQAHTFNDPVMITCASNDYGYEAAFSRLLSVYATSGDIVVAISSSGASENILSTVRTAMQLGCQTVTLSGFDPHNSLRSQGELNFYLDSTSYRHVERTHLFVLDCVLDMLLELEKIA